MTTEQLATDVLVRIHNEEGFARQLINNPEEALQSANLLSGFAALGRDDETQGAVYARHFTLTRGWHCESNTKGYTCHG